VNSNSQEGEAQFTGGANPSSRNSEPQYARIVSSSVSNSEGTVGANDALALNSLTSSLIGSKSGRQLPTTEQAKKLCRQIQAYLQEHYDVVLTGRNRDELLASIMETRLYPAEIWYFAVAELLYALDHSDNDGFARAQAASRVPATLACAFEPTAPGSPTVVDRYYENKSQPFTMQRQLEQMQKEAEARQAELAEEEPAEEFLPE
jgi:hypothetical protein